MKPAFDLKEVQKIRKDFPILGLEVHGKSLAYLDNGATTQKPLAVLNSLEEYYRQYNANVHRGAYYLSEKATEAYEGVRPKVCKFLGTSKTSEVIFTRGTTDALNLVCSSWGSENVKAGDEIVVTRMEHHSNFVPWQALAKRKGATFTVVELDSQGRLDLESLKKVLDRKPKILAITLMSNVLGTINPIREISLMAKEAGALVVVDGAQGVGHLPVNIGDLGHIDFFAFSSHKMCGPTGVGVLWGKEEVLDKMPPYQYGGDMILSVEDQLTRWNELPWKFEAGTPNIADVIAFGAAIDYLFDLDRAKIHAYETELTQKALDRLLRVPGLKILGPHTVEQRGAAVSFTLPQIHPHDLATYLDHQGIAVRAGHHCAQPLLKKLGVVASTRASFYFYNLPEEIDRLGTALEGALEYFGVKA